MDENQHWLAQIGVSSQSIEHLIEAAREAGALGAKLSGGGRGGNIIALSPSGEIETITAALLEAGAKRVIKTILTQGEGS
jgi:mevalonate kinase